ncbi:MAG: hypothetical protein WAM97_19980 [Acidimicrobiales bacterium]|jgi:hypothetical protein
MEPMKAVKASRVGRRALLLGGIGLISAASVAGVSYGLTSSSSGTTVAQVATSTTPASGTSTTPKIRQPYQRARAVLRRAVSGSIEIDTKNGFVTIDFDRGTVSSISSSGITVLRPDGMQVSEAVTSKTHMPKAGVPTKGENVIVVSDSGNALYIFKVGPFHPLGNGKKSTGSSSTSGSSSTTTSGSTLSL